MDAVLEKMVLNLAIPFIFRQLDQFRDQIDWKKVEQDLEAKILGHVPKCLDTEIVVVIKFVLKVVQDALAKGDAMKQIVQLLADKKWAEALDALKGFVFASLNLNHLLAANDSEKAKELFSNLS